MKEIDLAIGIGDDPFARDQLCDLGAHVGDADVILEQVRSITRGAAVGNELAEDLDADPSCRGIAHPDAACGRIGHKK